MLQVIVIMLKRTSSVVGWINIDTFDLSLVEGKQCFQSNQVVAVNNQIFLSILRISIHGLPFKEVEGNLGRRTTGFIIIDPMKNWHNKTSNGWGQNFF